MRVRARCATVGSIQGEHPMPDPLVDGFLRAHLEKEMLKYACGYQIQCACGVVLDCRRAVSADFYANRPGLEQAALFPGRTANEGEKLVSTLTACSSCMDAAADSLVRHAARFDLRVAWIDGRRLWPSRAAKPRRVRTSKARVRP